MKAFLTWFTGGLGLFTLLLGAGCVSAIDEPVLEVGLANLRLTQATLFETTAILDIRLDNLAPEEIRVTGGSHRVTVNGVRLGRGLTGESVSVARLSSTVQSVEFHLKNLSMARSIHELSRSRLVDYELESVLYVARPGGGDRAIRVQRTGQLDLQAVGGRQPTALP
jgi:LEA14-like dessication related protein